MNTDFIIKVFTLLPGLLLAFTIHEMCHAWAAYQLGDPTAKYQGRLTLNPLMHLDPVGTVMLVLTSLFSGMAFGWAKPVQFDPRNLRHPRRDGALIAAAGPLSNFVLAFLLGLLFRMNVVQEEVASRMLLMTIVVNVGLGIFNLIPIPPLDGSKVLKALVPEGVADTLDEWEARYANIIPFLLLFLILSPIFNKPFGLLFYTVMHLMIGG